MLSGSSVGGAEVFDVRTRVLVAELHDPERESVCEAVRQDPRFELVACCPDSSAAVARALEFAPDVLVLDSVLPQGALAAAVEIRARLPAARLIVTHQAGDDDFLEAVTAGASAYLARADGSDRLLQAIAEVGAGEIVLTGAQIGCLVEAVRDPARPRRRVATDPALTAREWQVGALLRDGRTRREIAEQLFLSPVTVRSHVRSIRRKLAAVDEGRNPIHR